MNKKGFFLSGLIVTGLLTVASWNSSAQQWQDTLKEVLIEEQHKDTVTEAKKQFTAGQQAQSIEKVYRDIYQSQSLANLLAQQTPVFVKSYGINGMATLSFRGASAAQSSVLWNGVPILNPALGVADISILSTGLFDQISLQYGSASALYGSGNVGGALMLGQNDPAFITQRKASLTLGAGSYGRKDIALNTAFQNHRWRIGIRAFYQYALNDFRYRDNAGEERTLENARLEAGGVLFSADYNLGKNSTPDHVLSLQLWYQKYLREIPPALYEPFSEKRQADESVRSLLGWHKQTLHSYFYAKASLNREYLCYQDGVVLPDNRNHVTQYYQELGWKYRMANPQKQHAVDHYLLFSMPLQYAVAEGQNMPAHEDQFRPAVVAAYHISAWDNKLKANTALRQEWVNGKAAPLLPGAGASFRILSLVQGNTVAALELLANVQRTYRIPTLNELYYFPGGNSRLKPEQGWNEDGGYQFSLKLGKTPKERARFTFQHEVHFFNRNIHDWIYWLGGAIWTPYNIAEVHSRGMETDNDLQYNLGKIVFHAGMKYAYVLSTTVSSYLPNDGSIGRQVPYAPRYNGQLNIGAAFAGFYLNYNHTYTGYRFVTVDESQYLDPYHTGNLQAMYTLAAKTYRLQLAAQVQNIWNTRYEVVNARPMPGRYLLLSLQLGWLQ